MDPDPDRGRDTPSLLGRKDVRGMRIISGDGEEFPVDSAIRQSTIDGKIPVEFDGQSGEGDIYRGHLGRLYLVRYGSERAEVIDWG